MVRGLRKRSYYGFCLDLGGRAVELYHFGHGHTAGDTVVYVPEVRITWVGKLIRW